MIDREGQRSKCRQAVPSGPLPTLSSWVGLEAQTGPRRDRSHGEADVERHRGLPANSQCQPLTWDRMSLRGQNSDRGLTAHPVPCLKPDPRNVGHTEWLFYATRCRAICCRATVTETAPPDPSPAAQSSRPSHQWRVKATIFGGHSSPIRTCPVGSFCLILFVLYILKVRKTQV